MADLTVSHATYLFPRRFISTVIEKKKLKIEDKKCGLKKERRGHKAIIKKTNFSMVTSSASVSHWVCVFVKIYCIYRERTNQKLWGIVVFNYRIRQTHLFPLCM